MSSTFLTEAVVTSMGVAETALTIGVGYGIKRLFTTASDTATKVTMLVTQVQPMEKRLATLESLTDSVSVVNAVMGDRMERHERWHERNDPRPPTRGDWIGQPLPHDAKV